jgi:hypothetical protein
MRELISKKISLPTKEEIEKCMGYIINEAKKGDFFGELDLTIDEEIDYSLDIKNNIISTTKIELVFNSKEIIVLINIITVMKNDSDILSYDNIEDNFRKKNSFIDPNGNFLFANDTYKIVGGKISKMMDCQKLFDSARKKISTL